MINFGPYVQIYDDFNAARNDREKQLCFQALIDQIFEDVEAKVREEFRRLNS